MSKKILCAVDGSYSANRAAACAADLAKEMGANLTFIHVNMVPAERLPRTVFFWDESLLPAVEAQIHTQLAHAFKAAAEQGVTNFGSVVVTGDKASTAIVSYAKDRHGNRRHQSARTHRPRLCRDRSRVQSPLPRYDRSLREPVT